MSTFVWPEGAVTVEVPARLHLGFLDLSGQHSRRFGGLGLAIQAAKTRLTIRASGSEELKGPEQERVVHYLFAMKRILGLGGSYSITMHDSVPPHCGLGSGTQIALAVASGLRRLHGLPLDIRADAHRLGRGLRSGVGIASFETGGFVVDGGKGPSTGVPPVVSRMAFPEEWRVILVLDPKCVGVHGNEELAAFKALAPMSEYLAAHFSRLVLLRALPAIAERDIAAFGAVISEIQDHLGGHYAPVQGGHAFLSSHVAETLNLLRQNGATGIGQSSWGPSGFAFVPSDEDARRLLTLVRTQGNRFASLQFLSASADNEGAIISQGRELNDR